MKAMLRKLGVVDKAGFWHLVVQIILFGLVGALNAVISLAVYYSIVSINANWYVVANIAGWIVSVASAYLLNRKFVFRDSSVPFIQGFIKCYITYAGSLLLSTILLLLWVEVLRVSEQIAPLINIVLMIPLNFLTNKLFTFKESKT